MLLHFEQMTLWLEITNPIGLDSFSLTKLGIKTRTRNRQTNSLTKTRISRLTDRL